MKIVAIEPTPNPNSMKLTLDEALPVGIARSYTHANAAAAPAHVQRLLGVPGVKSVYMVTDFMALERQPNMDWQPILAGARAALAETTADAATPPAPSEAFGEVKVFVQMFRGIPGQIKLLTGSEDIRVGLPERFARAIKQAAMAAPNYIAERKWVAKGVRYGDPHEIGAEIADQIDASHSDARLQELVAKAMEQGDLPPAVPEELPPNVVLERLANPDWRQRYAALDQMNPTADSMPVLLAALQDTHPSVRRLATVYLGAVEDAETLPYLLAALRDETAVVRRAAGDCLSDQGDPAAIPAMCVAMGDPSKLVRWRAARFLYEVGDASALPALRAAASDPEFEVQLQAKMAIERIEGGLDAAGPVWQQMTRLLENQDKDKA